jgi:acetolactate synthase small subunit
MTATATQPVAPWTLMGQSAAVRFTLTAEAEPGLMPRLVQPFARRDLTPDSFECSRSGDALRVVITMAAMPAEMVHLVEGNLRQTVGVTSVVCRREITGSVRRRAA